MPACAGIGQQLVEHVKLKRPVADLILFDGSYCPPRRAWPVAAPGRHGSQC
jgi:hypothetical protein